MANKTRLVGSILYLPSGSISRAAGTGAHGESSCGTGPTMSDGHIIDCSFSKCSVNNLPDGDGNDSNDEKDDSACGCIAGDTAPDAPAPDLRGYVGPERSSPEDTGDANPGDIVTTSSASDVCALSSDAAKLLDISGSDTNAYDDCVDAVDIVDVVRSRAESRDVRGSSCHAELAKSTFP